MAINKLYFQCTSDIVVLYVLNDKNKNKNIILKKTAKQGDQFWCLSSDVALSRCALQGLVAGPGAGGETSNAECSVRVSIYRPFVTIVVCVTFFRRWFENYASLFALKRYSGEKRLWCMHAIAVYVVRLESVLCFLSRISIEKNRNGNVF